MAGRGVVEQIDTTSHPRVLMLDQKMNWVLAKEPVHFDKPIAGTGLGLMFGKEMAKQNENIKIGLIPCAKGGSSITKWFADSLHEGTNSYPYDEMIKRTQKALETGTLKGILWHQGESDTGSEDAVKQYKMKFRSMLDSLYSDLDIDPVPMVIGELGYFFYHKAPLAEDLNEVLNQIASQNDCVEIVSAESLSHKGDSIHFNSNAYREMGIRYANKMKEITQVCD